MFRRYFGSVAVSTVVMMAMLVLVSQKAFAEGDTELCRLWLHWDTATSSTYAACPPVTCNDGSDCILVPAGSSSWKCQCATGGMATCSALAVNTPSGATFQCPANNCPGGQNCVLGNPVAAPEDGPTWLKTTCVCI